MTPFDEIKTILDRIAATGTHTEADRTALLSALRVDGRGNIVVQIGKYNVHIEQGQDIQIGDRITYEGPDAEAIRQTIRQMLEEYRLRPGIPFQAPPLPEHFVPRPEATDALKARLLTNRSATTPGILVVSAIHGLGGIGKSTLAAALAYDPEVQRRFKDGILWATLGQQPDLLSLLNGWVQALGDYDFRPTTVEAASTHLRSLLHDKAALLVVDDAWDPAHPGPFQVGGIHCQVVITTRETLIAQVVGAMLYDLDVMTPAQSLALLAGRLRRNLTATERDQALVLAGVVGYLPLALELAGAQVADGLPWAELLADLQAEIARLEVLNLAKGAGVADEASRKRLSLLASFDLSLRRLPTETRQQFVWLGVLPEDANLTPAMATTLWETDERTASETLRYLRGKALLLPSISRPDGAPTYRLHDLLHDLAHRLITAPVEPAQTDDLPGLGLTLATAHAALLDRYRARTSNKLWHTLPDDSYIHTHLTWHMKRTGQVDQIHTLLREETAEGRNGWYEACERLGQLATFIKDVYRAWKLAEEKFAIYQTSRLDLVALQCRYALIATSLNSLAQNVPLTLLKALVEKGAWSPMQGLAYAHRVPDHSRRRKILVELAQFLPENHKSEVLGTAIEAARMIEDEENQARVLVEIVQYLPELLKEQVLKEALNIAQKVKEKKRRMIILADLIPHLSESFKVKAIKDALVPIPLVSYLDDQEYGLALVKISSHLPEPVKLEVQHVALAVLKNIPKPRQRAETFGKAIQYLPTSMGLEFVKEALKAAYSIESDIGQADALMDLAHQLAKHSHPQEALKAAKGIDNELKRAVALAGLAQVSYLPISCFKRLLK